MATVYGTILGVVNVKRNDTPDGARNVARIAVDFGAYTGSSDSGAVSAVTTAIQNSLRNGKTATIRSAICSGAGSDGTQAIYTGAITVSSPNMTFDLTNAAGSELTSSVATTRPVMIDVAFDES